MINFNNNQSVHFIGIGGVSMHNLALFCASLGWSVSGSDIRANEYTKICKSNGIQVGVPHSVNNIVSPNFIVRSGSIGDDNVEVMYAKKLGIKIYDRSEFLKEITKKFDCVIGVAGTHGKSTTSALIYEILKANDFPVSCHIGADIKNAKINLQDKYLVVEACEYNKSFLNLKVDIGCVLNVEPDHLECYGSFYQLKNSFLTFIKRAKNRYVLDNLSTKYISLNNLKKLSCCVIDNKSFVFDGELYNFNHLVGEQYIQDAIMAIKVCEDLKVDKTVIKRVVENFEPLKRRQEKIGQMENTNIYIDYAHHPTELKYLLSTFNKNALLVFQPHTFSRTKFLEKEFVEILKGVDVVIYKEYSARENKSDGESAEQLYKKVVTQNKECSYAKNFKDIVSKIDYKKYDNIVFAGAGDIAKIAKKYYKYIFNN